MKATIQQKLNQLEQQYNIKILFASESGSRGWGFPSPDSDYDVRFIFKRPVEEYLTIQKKNDQLTFPVNDELDISGWDLDKTLQLVTKSNSSPIEWLQSPIVYGEVQGFRDDLWSLCEHYFCARTCTHHYLGIAKGAMATIEGETIKIKKLFYVLRPLLAAQWCIEKRTLPPMNINPLMQLLPDNLKQEVEALINLKAASEEQFMINIHPELKIWINDTFNKCIQESATLEKKQPEIAKADIFFRNTIKA